MRRAKLEKIPYVLVVGDDDAAAGTVGVNTRDSERPERGVPVADLVARLAADVAQADQADDAGQAGQASS